MGAEVELLLRMPPCFKAWIRCGARLGAASAVNAELSLVVATLSGAADSKMLLPVLTTLALTCDSALLSRQAKPGASAQAKPPPPLGSMPGSHVKL